jgi:hypothetical protein
VQAKAHEAERNALTEAERAAIQILKQALQEHWRELSDALELALHAALRLGATPYLSRSENRLRTYHPERLTPAVWQTLKDNERETFALLAKYPPPPLPENR